MQTILSRLARPFSTGTGPLRFGPDAPVPAAALPEGAQKATVAAGCFWGVEHMFRRAFGAGTGLLDARVGYTGGETSSPSYRSVCGGRTGHAEALQVVFDPDKVSYRELLEFFYRMHDPTTANRQGPDAGPQYRSAIFAHDDEQLAVARDVTDRVAREWWAREGPVATEVVKAGTWYDAETYHQQYLDQNPGGYECPSHFLRKFPPLSS